MIVAEGDYFGGYSLWILDGKAHFSYSLLGIEEKILVSSEKIQPGKTTLTYIFTADEPGKPGTGGQSELFIDSKKVAETRFHHTVPLQFTISAGFDIGRDNGRPVGSQAEYIKKSPFLFTGTIEKVTFELGPQHSEKRQMAGHMGPEPNP